MTTWYFWRRRAHSNDCTSLTNGEDADLCYQENEQDLIVYKNGWKPVSPRGCIDASVYNDLNEAINDIGSTKKTLLVSKDISTSANLTIPKNITLKFIYPAKIAVPNGITLTVNGAIEAGLWQIFDGDGSVNFEGGVIKEVYPEWWGAVGDGKVDDTNALQKAGATYLPVVLRPNSRYKVTEEVIGFCFIGKCPGIQTDAGTGIPETTIYIASGGSIVINKRYGRVSGIAFYTDVDNTVCLQLKDKAINVSNTSFWSDPQVSGNIGIKIDTSSGPCPNIKIDHVVTYGIDYPIYFTGSHHANAPHIAHCNFANAISCIKSDLSAYCAGGSFIDLYLENSTNAFEVDGSYFCYNYIQGYLDSVTNFIYNTSDTSRLHDLYVFLIKTPTNWLNPLSVKGFLFNSCYINTPSKDYGVLGINGTILELRRNGVDHGVLKLSTTPITVSNSPYTLQYTSKPSLMVDASGGDVTIILPSPPSYVSEMGWYNEHWGGLIVSIMKIDISPNAVILDAGSKKIGNTNTYRLTSPYSYVLLQLDRHLNWRIMSSSGRDMIVFSDGDTTPSVANGIRVAKTANSTATNITTFDDGLSGQKITIIFGDSNTTIVHGSGIYLRGGTNVTPPINTTMSFVYDGSYWYEE